MGVSNGSLDLNEKTKKKYLLFCAENHFQFKSVEKAGTHLCTVVLPNPGDCSPPHNNTPPMVKVHSAG